jgi:glutathione synthase/RimK-type ligase-like ATP-grasp enzyme
MITRVRKSILFCHLRQYFPMNELQVIDDRDRLSEADVLLIDWPAEIKKPMVGIVQDYGRFPRWTKYCRFLEANSIPYEFYPIQDHDWLERSKKFDVILGVPSNELFRLEELRTKYYLLETYLGKFCYPSMREAYLYEDKILEASFSEIYGFPYIETHVSFDKQDALRLIEKMDYPFVSKISPSSGSVGVQLIQSKAQARSIVNQAFSNNGRITHVVYARQKNFVYFQKFLPNDGYDIRIIMAGNRAFGYYRGTPKNDFRASGMHLEEKRSLPEDGLKLVRRMYKTLKFPQLVVDMLHGLDGKYYINEFSPVCQQETPMQLMVDGVPGAYVFDDDDHFHFEPGKQWVHDLVLKEFFLNHYLSMLTAN